MPRSCVGRFGGGPQNPYCAGNPRIHEQNFLKRQEPLQGSPDRLAACTQKLPSEVPAIVQLFANWRNLVIRSYAKCLYFQRFVNGTPFAFSISESAKMLRIE